jgi:hypothetical protein
MRMRMMYGRISGSVRMIYQEIMTICIMILR